MSRSVRFEAVLPAQTWDLGSVAIVLRQCSRFEGAFAHLHTLPEMVSIAVDVMKLKAQLDCLVFSKCCNVFARSCQKPALAVQVECVGLCVILVALLAR